LSTTSVKTASGTNHPYILADKKPVNFNFKKHKILAKNKEEKVKNKTRIHIFGRVDDLQVEN
jgi:hypothetical protein